MLLNLLKWLEREAVTICAIETNDLRRISELAIKYSDLNPDFADRALLSLAERIKVDTVLTLDKADFSIYRLKNGKHLKNVLAH